MNTIAIVREALELHQIESDSPRNVYEAAGFTQKCAGCPWIGWDHTLHQSKVVVEVLQRARALEELRRRANDE